MVAFLRKVQTASGATAVQVVAKEGRRYRVLEHLGSAHSEAELAALMHLGRERLHAGQEHLDPDRTSKAAPSAGVLRSCTSPRGPWRSSSAGVHSVQRE
jgi:hypothetical protein